MIESLVGKTLAERYHILEVIGTGGMATVYKAQCEVLKRDVAIKVLRDTVRDDETALKSFKQEAQAAAKLSHNNIIQVFDVAEEDGLEYMVMELVDGITLKKYIYENGPLSCREAIEFAIQIAQALEAAHSKNVIHRDIKPHNILVTDDKTLKVTDFGIAKAAGTETLVVDDHNARGSVHYISPEQARGGFTDARSDIYSLGVVLFEMLTGKVPFDGESAVAVALMHIEKQPPSVLDLNPNVPSALADIVAKAISKEQSSRYQTSTELIDDLNAVLASKPIDVVVPADVDDIDETLEFRIDEKDLKKKKHKKEKTPKTPEQKKADRTATILAFITVIIIMLAAFGIYANMRKSTGRVIVPDFTNASLEDAVKLATEKGLVIYEEVEYSLSDEIEEGRIISQTPAAKSFAKKSDPIHVVVSIGSSGGNIATPYVKGVAVEDAINEIIENDLTYILNEEYSESTPIGIVIRQSPDVGTKLNKDDVVSIYVSMGPTPASKTPTPTEDVIVPSLYGETRTAAEALCNQWNLKLVSVNSKPSDMPAGTVISQSPEAGKQVVAGTQLSIVLSTGISLGGEEFVAPTVVPVMTLPPEEGEDPAEANLDVTKEFTMVLPEGDGSVDVKITVDGDTEFEKTKNYGDTVSIDITGRGRKRLVVFLDGKIAKEEHIEFN